MVESSKFLSSSCKAVFQKIFKKYSEPLVHQKGCHGISLLSASIHVSFFTPCPSRVVQFFVLQQVGQLADSLCKFLGRTESE